MTRRQFVTQRRDSWRRFEELIAKFGRRSKRKTTSVEAAEFSRLFREVCYDLALIRSRDWGRGLVSYLNNLVSRGHNAFYSAPPGNLAYLWRFLASGFPGVFRANIGYFLTASFLFFVPFCITWAIIQHDPSLAGRIVEQDALDEAEKMYRKELVEERTNSRDFANERSAMAGFYTMNNTGIALTAFARGILLGVGTAYTLLFNGIHIGAVVGFVIASGHGERILSFMVTHGSFELTAIAVSGGAGLMLGDALVRPGRRSRLESLRERGKESIQIACGAAVMLMTAAIIEAFWSPAPIPAALKYAVGALLWVLVFLYLGVVGRNTKAQT